MIQYIFFSLLICLFLGCSSSEKEANIITTPDDYATYDTIPQYVGNEVQSNVSSNFASNNTTYNNFGMMNVQSEEERLEAEYERLSKEIDALQAEFKAVINTQMVAQDYLASPFSDSARKAYEKKMKILLKIQQENEQNGLPLGPYVADSNNISWVVQTLKSNYDILSDKISALKKKKGKVASEQLFLKAKGY